MIDIAKHAVLGKFNDIRPGIYREYMRDLCSDSLDKHSHNIHKLVSLKPLQLLHNVWPVFAQASKCGKCLLST